MQRGEFSLSKMFTAKLLFKYKIFKVSSVLKGKKPQIKMEHTADLSIIKPENVGIFIKISGDLYTKQTK